MYVDKLSSTEVPNCHKGKISNTSQSPLIHLAEAPQRSNLYCNWAPSFPLQFQIFTCTSWPDLKLIALQPHFLQLHKSRKFNCLLEGLSQKPAPIKKGRKKIQDLISEPNFLLAGTSHHQALSFKSDEEHCPGSLGLTHFTLRFSQKLLGQHIHQLPVGISVEKKPQKPFLFLWNNPTSNPRLPGSPQLAQVQMPLQSAFRGWCWPQGLAFWGQRCPRAAQGAGTKNKTGPGTGSQTA